VQAQFEADLKRLEVADFAGGLVQALQSGRCLLVLDGLDEVPQALRQRVRQTVAALSQFYRAERIIVTCRVRSYTGPAQLPNFTAHTIAPFDPDKIRTFARAWYAAQHELGRLSREQAQAKAGDLAQAALATGLAELAPNPMLLTTMALIHQRDIGLPNERVRLYSLAVEVLLRRWQKQKRGEAELAPSAGLVAFLKDDHRLRPALERLAYQAHQAGQAQPEAADLGRGTALTLLEGPEYLADTGLAAEFLDYVDQSSGLLVGRGGDPARPVSYSFPHRTFQEYLAGCYIIGRRTALRQIYSLAGQAETWALAVQLGAEELLYNLRRPNDLLDLMYGLCPTPPPVTPQAQRAVLWAGQMALLAGPGLIERDSDSPEGGPAYLARQISHLLHLLGSDLPAPERAEAGDALAGLGDPRDLAELVEIPAGPFLMDDDKIEEARPRHEITLPAFKIGKYPVTNGQFAAFIAAGGYGEQRWWLSDGWHWHEQEEWREPRYWRDSRFWGLNRPVVGVSWYEAMAYCAWLTEQWRDQGKIGPAEVVRLPSEAEWEKAARGSDGRQYPWGDAWDEKKCNTRESQIGRTSAVGMYPAGASPYGCLDLAGNVWEWTRSVFEKYPYDPRDGREDLNRTNVHRVLRGVSWDNHRRNARVPGRGRIDPNLRSHYYGFRVMVAPISQASGL
jgi:formylglycine-generating enzyme required for sulfatase activity